MSGSGRLAEGRDSNPDCSILFQMCTLLIIGSRCSHYSHVNHAIGTGSVHETTATPFRPCSNLAGFGKDRGALAGACYGRPAPDLVCRPRRRRRRQRSRTAGSPLRGFILFLARTIFLTSATDEERMASGNSTSSCSRSPHSATSEMLLDSLDFIRRSSRKAYRSITTIDR